MKLEIKYDLPNKLAYFNLFESTGWNNEYKASPGLLIETLLNSWFFVTVYHDNKLVGSGRVITDGFLHALILDIMILPVYQKCGIGKLMMKVLVEKCLEAGINDIQLFCSKGKMGFYRKQGFRERPPDAPGMEYHQT